MTIADDFWANFNVDFGKRLPFVVVSGPVVEARLRFALYSRRPSVIAGGAYWPLFVPNGPELSLRAVPLFCLQIDFSSISQ